MAKKKSGFGRFLGAITGSPYERLLKQVDKMVDQYEDDQEELASQLEALVDQAGDAFEEENIDEEEHDLIIEAIEEADPDGRVFSKLSSEEDAFYGGDIPDAPELKREKRINLDDLMKAKGDEFTGSFGRDEFEEFRDRMTDEFYEESDNAIRQGDHQAEIRTTNRVFGGAESDVDDAKRRISEESGLVDPKAAEAARIEAEAEADEEEYDDENYSIDENGVEWFEDEDGYWWYREEGQDDWQPYDED
ncbi:MAG: hypothetical protein ISP83_07800 [Candidatus Poseidonia sp.]|nr:hypothetical protein [Poseidonia sp.]MBL6748108.1 hypothetical protein [Poseidonia sp.]MBL6807406.1 hypothetical protein [Poseidonia sp.]MBL6887115.1 hypothetical protein [Poseidonia sp.]MBL6893335.1 hypothetical protein [Poseidonia sp.]